METDRQTEAERDGDTETQAGRHTDRGDHWGNAESKTDAEIEGGRERESRGGSGGDALRAERTRATPQAGREGRVAGRDREGDPEPEMEMGGGKRGLETPSNGGTSGMWLPSSVPQFPCAVGEGHVPSAAPTCLDEFAHVTYTHTQLFMKANLCQVGGFLLTHFGRVERIRWHHWETPIWLMSEVEGWGAKAARGQGELGAEQQGGRLQRGELGWLGCRRGRRVQGQGC